MTRPPSLPPDFPPGRLNYADARSAPARFNWYALSWHLIGWALLETLLIVMVTRVLPRFEEIFNDFKLDLPAPTKTLLALSRGSGIMLVIVTAAVSIAHAFAAAAWYPHSSRFGRFLYGLVLFLLSAAVIAFVVLALFMPMISLIDGVSGSGSRK
jgi:type II secretory pathway component PulF